MHVSVESFENSWVCFFFPLPVMSYFFVVFFYFQPWVVIKLFSRWLFTLLSKAQRHREQREAPAMQKLEPASQGCGRSHQLLSGTSLRVVTTPVSAASLELPARI